MIVVVLARTREEAFAHTDAAGVARRDVVVPAPGGRNLEGLRLLEDDLVVELPSFAGKLGEQGIRDTLARTIAKTRGPAPRYEVITGKR